MRRFHPVPKVVVPREKSVRIWEEEQEEQSRIMLNLPCHAVTMSFSVLFHDDPHL